MSRGSITSALAEGVYEKSLDCVHCGLCLSSCPTYIETGRETSSPRGRIYLMRGIAEGRAQLGEAMAEEAYLCLGCRACESACPSGVQYGAMLESVRASVDEAGLRRGWGQRIERVVLRSVVPRKRVLHALVGLVAIAQRLGLDRAVLPLLPEALRELHPMLPEIPAAAERAPLPAFTAAQGEKRGRVAFFVGCVMPEIFGAVHRATIRVLSEQGFEVVVPASQGCCGALQAHSGDLPFARRLARENLRAFARDDFDAVVVNSAGCGAALRDVHHWLPDEDTSAASRIRDICEWLDEVGYRVGAGAGRSDPQTPLRVCYDDPCHLTHGQGVTDAPRRLLAQLPGIELVPHADPGSCCGAAGIYNLTHREMAQKVLSRKLDSLAAAAPDLIASGNPGCMMQLQAGARARGLRARVLHPVELL